MDAGLKSYEQMKDSGVEWLGEVPEHWGVRRLRNTAKVLFSNVDKHSKDDEIAVRLCNYSDVYHNDRIHSEMSFMRATATADEINRFRLNPGDVLITKDSESWDDIGVPALVQSSASDVICGYHLALLRPISGITTGDFLHRALTCRGVATQLFVRANGVTRFGLSQSAIKSCLLPVPPPAEQTAIARFLEHATVEIESYIRTKEKLIELLEEQKQVIIHDAVTGRIDVRTGRPYPSYKPSGIKWLGDVPSDWLIGPLKRFVARRRSAIKAGPFGSQLTADEMAGTDIKVYTQRNVIDRNLKSGKNYISIEKFETLRPFEVVPGDVLVTSRGTIGRTVLMTEDCERGILHPCLIRVCPDTDYFIAEYLVTLIQDSKLLPQQLSLLSNATTIDVIYSDTLANIIVPVPSIAEQGAILTYIFDTISLYDRYLAQSHREIKLLREYRTRLTTDVVTGKLDVREVDKILPDGDTTNP